MSRKNPKRQDSCLKKLFSTVNKEEVEKAIIIENNHVHTYGYQKYCMNKPENV